MSPKKFFTSDTHINHANVIKYCARPFASIEEMNREMIARWNAAVGPEDEVYHLGDFAMGKALSRNNMNNSPGQFCRRAEALRGAHAEACKPSSAKAQPKSALALRGGPSSADFFVARCSHSWLCSLLAPQTLLEPGPPNCSYYFLTAPKPAEWPAILRRLNGAKKILIRGNHDRSSRQMLEGGFDAVHEKLEWNGWMLQHHPIATNRKLLCGHIHEKWTRIGWVINVGVDVWNFTPRSIEELTAAAESPREYKCRYCGSMLKRLQNNSDHRDGKCLVGSQ